MKSYWIVLARIVVFPVLLGTAALFGQTENPAAPAAVNTSAAATASGVPTEKIALTDAEAKDLEFNQLQIENLDFKVEQLRKQIMEAKQKLANDTKDLTAKFAKAHNVDLARYRLDPQAKAFLPLPPAAAKK